MNCIDFKARYNVMNVSSLNEFLNVKGGINNNCKDVYFIRMVGVNNTFFEDIEKVDKVFTEKTLNGICIYNRIKEFPRIVSAEDIEHYSKCYNEWIQTGKKKISVKASSNNDILIAIRKIFNANQ